MNALDWLLRTSWQVAALVLLILAVQRILGSSLTPRWRYALWWIVVLRLVLPPISIAGLDLQESLAGPEGGPSVAVSLESGPVDSAVAAAPATVAPTAANPSPPSDPDPVPAIPVAAGMVGESAGIPISRILLLLWITGAVGLALVTLLREARAASRLGFASPVRYPEVLPLIDRCRAEAGIGRRVSLGVTDRTRVPALIGLFRPRLLLPPSILDSLSPEELRYVIHHELEHVRHHDLAVNWLLQLLLCLHWMNPFVWIAFARLRSDREVVRDLGVLGRTAGTSGPAYGRIILRIVELAVPVRAPVARVAILETRKDVKRRVTMLARYEGKAVRGAISGAALTICLALLATVAASQGGREAAADRPAVLVTGFSVSGELLRKESQAAASLEALTEAILADHAQTASFAQLEEACGAVGCRVEDLPRSADLRLLVAKEMGGAKCVSGWACSFGNRVVLIVEVIDPDLGLPGRVHRGSCDGLEGIPDALEQLLGAAGLLQAEQAREVEAHAEVEVEPEPDLPDNDLLDTYPNDAWRKYLKLREAAAVSSDPRDRIVLDRLLAESMEHARRLKEDRDYLDEWIIRTNVRLHPVYQDYDCDVLRRGPYLIFVQKCGDPDVLKAAARMGSVLESFYRGFFGLFGEDLGLAPLADRERSYERVLKVLVVTKRDTFKQVPLPPGVEGFYSPKDQWIVLFIDEGQPLTEQRRTALRMGLVHEATHQLIHYLTKFKLEESREDEVLFADPELRPKRQWLSEGLAEVMAGAMGADGSMDPSRPNARRVKEWESSRRQKLNDWTLQQILSIRSTAEIRQRAARMGLAQSGRLVSLFYAQAASLCHFLWNHEDPAHREFLTEELRRELASEPIGESVGTVTDVEEEWRASLKD